MNRLHLDWNLSSFEDRLSYISQPNVIPPNATEQELETIANYCLWGKDPDGKNLHQKHLIDLPSKNKAWDRAENQKAFLSSYNELAEHQTQDGDLLERDIGIPYYLGVAVKRQRETFNRTEERLTAPQEALAALEVLWHSIDQTELTIQLAENKAPRQDLLQRFTGQELETLFNKAAILGKADLLKLKRQLVQLRQQQFQIRDSYHGNVAHVAKPQLQTQNYNAAGPTTFNFQPDGNTVGNAKAANEVVKRGSTNTDDLHDYLAVYYRKKKEAEDAIENAAASSTLIFDWRDEKSIEKLLDNYQLFKDLIEETDNVEDREALQEMMEWFQFYKEEAELDEKEEAILMMKLEKKSNKDIVKLIEEKFQHHYTVNYISTIFRQKVVKKMANAARLHQKKIESLGIEEEWKTCSACGRTLLLDEWYFTHSKSNKSGFGPKCKRCQKEARDRKKEQK